MLPNIEPSSILLGHKKYLVYILNLKSIENLDFLHYLEPLETELNGIKNGAVITIEGEIVAIIARSEKELRKKADVLFEDVLKFTKENEEIYKKEQCILFY